ncbi:DUF6622 family protein [Candidatus Pantoea formicae]|uniref:DUF6622 family protein n=1 Tax=Candidatus Pantoea formicae TaxID=2608355 RepID=UPI003ED933E4
MNMMDLIQHTPVWVWVLFIYLIFRGLKALHTREVAVQKLFYIPLLFLIWGLFGVFRETTWLAYTLLAMIAGVLVGGATGALLSRATAKPLASGNRDTITRPGSVLPLIFMLLAFVIKYTLSVAVVIHPELTASLQFNLLHGALSGLTIGIFWGSMLVYFIPWYHHRKKFLS